MAAGDKIGVVMEPQRGVPHGVATLDQYGILDPKQRPAVSGPAYYTTAQAVGGAGWHRICTGRNCIAIVVFGNIYNQYGPSGIVLLVNMTYHAPRINILMTGSNKSDVLFNKVRLSANTYNDVMFLDAYYTVSMNTLYSYSITFYTIGDRNSFVMNTFEKIESAPSITLIPEMAITSIPSGSLVTSGQLTAAIERGLSL